MITHRDWQQRRRPFIKAAFRPAFWIMIMGLLAVSFFSSGVLQAQEASPQLFISSADASSAPTIILRAYGIDEQGRPLDLANTALVVLHDGQPVENAEVIGDYKAGTFTVFVVDTPPGVEPQLTAIQTAIEGYASAPNMEERVDYIAIYQVGESAATQLMAPTHFYNSVRNFFANPLPLQTGPTALFDSLGTLLNEINSLKPKDDLFTSVVLMTDGTDVVSTQFAADQLAPLALSQNVPVHTVWLENVNLQTVSQELGQTSLAELAAGSRGLSARLDQEAEVEAIWSRIASFRSHTQIQYTIDDLAGGDYNVVLRLPNSGAEDATAVTITASAPSVVINLPAESRELTLPDLTAPVQLSFSATVTWLDGVERELTNAELLVNGVTIQTLDVDSLDRFSAQINNFSYGENTIQLKVVDDQGRQATSPPISLTIGEGETQVPEEIQADGGVLDSSLVRILLGCVVVLFLLAAFALLAAATRRWRILQRLGLASALRRIPFFRPFLRDAAGVQRYARQAEWLEKDLRRHAPERQESDWEESAPVASWPEEPQYAEGGQQPYAMGGGLPYLEILESVTRMPAMIDLTAAEHRIGRSPGQADIVFENDITVSRLHATLVLEGSEYRIYDEQSTSGTWVNGQPVPEYGQSLRSGDEIRLGAAVLRFHQG